MNKQSETFQHFKTSEGLPNNVVYSVLADEENNLWLSTNQGLAKFSPSSETFTNFRASDGLQDDEFNTASFFKNEETGKLFFGGIKGITAFHPKEIVSSNYAPKVYIT